jgi:2-oxoglutarate dehydrogenase E1 component
MRRARRNELTMDDYAGTTISLTNPGGIGTVHSMPRLLQGQGTIVGVGAMEHPAEFAGMSDEQLADLAISKIITLTSTYDHRIIQGAQSGEFLKVMHELLLGEHDFYDESSPRCASRTSRSGGPATWPTPPRARSTRRPGSSSSSTRTGCAGT